MAGRERSRFEGKGRMTQEPPGPTSWESPSGGGEPTPGQPPAWGQPGQQPGWGQPPAGGQPPGWGGQPGWGQPPAWGQSGQQPGWGAPPGAVGPWAMQAKPGIIPLRPLYLGEIFDGGFQAIRSNPRTMIGLSAVVLAIVTAVSAVPEAAMLRTLGSVVTRTTPTLEDALNEMNTRIEAGAIGQLMTVIAVQIVTAMLVLTVSTAVLGQRMSPGQAWQQVRSRVFAVLGLALVQTLALISALLLPILPGVGVAVAGALVPGVILAVLGSFVGTALAIFLGTRWAFTAPVLLLEEQRVFAAMGRSFRLVRGSFWRVLGITLLAQLLVGIGGALIQTPFSLISSLILGTGGGYDDFWTNLGQLSVQGVGQVIAGAVFYPFAAAVTTLLYIDVRMRREGLDVELLRAAEAARPT
jgi:hypothetical protein